MDIRTLLNGINRLILNPLIVLAFSVAFIVFLWGIFQFIASQAADDQRSEGKKKIAWGLFGMFIMFSAYGIIRLIVGTLGITGGNYLPL